MVIVVQSLDGKVKLFGSPADKDNLEVADEVLNVNERVLGDLPHAEVVRYLHEVNVFYTKHIVDVYHNGLCLSTCLVREKLPD